MERFTIGYFTHRREPMIEWFLSSLYNQEGFEPDKVKIIVVDFFCATSRKLWPSGQHPQIEFVPPKPCVWQGPHRLTKEDFFAASNARNTAIALCQTEWIAFVDDLSVLETGWLKSVQEAIREKYMCFGAYRKVKKLQVSDQGHVVDFEDHPGGHDSRWNIGSDDKAINCSGNLLYGCSCVLPMEGLLKINGFPEALCDGMGFEDSLTGIVLNNAGYGAKYDRRMLTLESEEMHAQGPVFRRDDFGKSPNDKSHRALEIAQATTRFTNDFGGGYSNIEDLRQWVISGGDFPIPGNPKYEYFTGRALSEL